MARGGKLTAKRFEKLKRQPGLHADGANLYLDTGANSASWLLRYMVNGKERWHGLGSASWLTPAEARELARQKLRDLKLHGIDPIEQKRAARAAAQAAQVRTRTFGEVADGYFEAHAPAWRHRAHITQWASTVLGRTASGQPVAAATDYCRELRRLPVASIGVPEVVTVLRPIWYEKPETASRLRARIAAVLDYAKAEQLRDGDNPAAVTLIGKLLPSRSKIAKVEHFSALAYSEIPALMSQLRQREGSAARALEFLILTCARTDEARLAMWPEIDLDAALWVLPAGRMKAGKEHRQPLAAAIVDLLRKLPREDGTNFLFLSSRVGQPLAVSAMLRTLRRLGYGQSVHGFRSAFSSWAHERSGASDHVIEICLAHSVGTAVSRVYRRTDLLNQRRRLLEAWADYCLSGETVAGGEVVPIGIGR